MHHQGPLRGGQGRPLPGGPAQGRVETLGGHRGPRGPGRDRLGRGQPARLPAAGPTLAQVAAQVGPLPEHATAHLDAGYDSAVTRELLDALGLDGEISRKGVPAPIQVGKRWVVECTHAWMNGYGKLRRCTDRDGAVVDFYLYLAAAFVTVRQLIQRARKRYRWDTRPTTKRLK